MMTGTDAGGRYIPNARMQYEYPGSYQAPDAQSCAADSNLLLHDDPDHYTDPYADPYEDDPNSQHCQCPAEEAEALSQQAGSSDSASKDGADADAGADASKSQAFVAESEQQNEANEENAGDGLPEQSVGTDVKR